MTDKPERSLPVLLARVLAGAIAAGLVFALLNLPFNSDGIVMRGVTFGVIMGIVLLGHALWDRRKARMAG